MGPRSFCVGLDTHLIVKTESSFVGFLLAFSLHISAPEIELHFFISLRLHLGKEEIDQCCRVPDSCCRSLLLGFSLFVYFGVL